MLDISWKGGTSEVLNAMAMEVARLDSTWKAIASVSSLCFAGRDVVCEECRHAL